MKARQDAHGARTRTSIHELANGIGTETQDEIKAARDEAKKAHDDDGASARNGQLWTWGLTAAVGLGLAARIEGVSPRAAMKAQQDAHETQTGQTLAEVIGEAREWMKAEAGKRWQPTPGRQRRRLPMPRPTWRRSPRLPAATPSRQESCGDVERLSAIRALSGAGFGPASPLPGC